MDKPTKLVGRGYRLEAVPRGDIQSWTVAEYVGTATGRSQAMAEFFRQVNEDRSYVCDFIIWKIYEQLVACSPRESSLEDEIELMPGTSQIDLEEFSNVNDSHGLPTGPAKSKGGA